jgi:hypothetical protein
MWLMSVDGSSPDEMEKRGGAVAELRAIMAGDLLGIA